MRETWVRILTLAVGYVTLVNSLILLSCWWHLAYGPWPRTLQGLRCMYGLHISSWCGCGPGQSLSPWFLIGMTGVVLTTGLHQGFRTWLWDSMPVFLFPDLFGSLLHLLSSCFLVHLSLSVSLFFFQLLLSHLYFILGNSVLRYEVWVCACFLEGCCTESS